MDKPMAAKGVRMGLIFTIKGRINPKAPRNSAIPMNLTIPTP